MICIILYVAYTNALFLDLSYRGPASLSSFFFFCHLFVWSYLKVPPELEAISNTTDAIHPGTSTSSAHLHHGLPHETSARKLLSKPSIKLMKSAFILIGGAICLSRGHSNLGVKVAMACILGNLTKQNASAFKKQKSKERGGLAGLTSHEDCGTIQ